MPGPDFPILMVQTPNGLREATAEEQRVWIERERELIAARPAAGEGERQ